MPTYHVECIHRTSNSDRVCQEIVIYILNYIQYNTDISFTFLLKSSCENFKYSKLNPKVKILCIMHNPTKQFYQKKSLFGLIIFLKAVPILNLYTRFY